MADGQMTQSTYLEIDACPGRITEEETARAEADAKQIAALAEIVDGGAKNRIVPLTPGSATSRGIVFTYNADGTIAVSGQNDNTGDSNATYRILQGDFSGYVISGTKYGGVIRLLDASTNSVIVSINRTTPSKVIPQNSASSIKIQLVIPQGSTDTGFVLYPMICSKPAWDISQKYVSYCPQMAELYQMILALQNGTRSVPAETRGDLRSLQGLTQEESQEETETDASPEQSVEQTDTAPEESLQATSLQSYPMEFTPDVDNADLI